MLFPSYCNLLNCILLYCSHYLRTKGNFQLIYKEMLPPPPFLCQVVSDPSPVRPYTVFQCFILYLILTFCSDCFSLLNWIYLPVLKWLLSMTLTKKLIVVLFWFRIWQNFSFVVWKGNSKPWTNAVNERSILTSGLELPTKWIELLFVLFFNNRHLPFTKTYNNIFIFCMYTIYSIITPHFVFIYKTLRLLWLKLDDLTYNTEYYECSRNYLIVSFV